MAKLSTTLKLATSQRTELLGRMRMAEWIEMPEREFAREIERLEKDDLFKKLYHGSGADAGVIRRQRWPRSRFAGIGELNERTAAGGERVRVEERLEGREALMSKIRQMGSDAFERYFLYAEEALPLAEIAKRTGLSLEEARSVNDLLVEIGAEAEFAGAPKTEAGEGSYCIARLSVERGGDPEFEFLSPHWARGLYHVRYEDLERIKRSGSLSGTELRHLPGLLKRLETVNLRQNTMFRIMESLTKLQSDYLRTRNEKLRRPVSLRMLARRLDLAPSTISRALSERTIRLPWEKETPLIALLPGRRRQLRIILEGWLAEDASPTDAAFAERLRSEHGIAVSRRTVNAVRHELRSKR